MHVAHETRLKFPTFPKIPRLWVLSNPGAIFTAHSVRSLLSIMVSRLALLQFLFPREQSIILSNRVKNGVHYVPTIFIVSLCSAKETAVDSRVARENSMIFRAFCAS
jgi:hypothetical protein